MANQDIARGRQVVAPLTNRSGGTISTGDVVIVSTAFDESFTTSTTSNYSATRLGIAQETIGITSNGRILIEGYAPQVNTTGTVTRGLGVYHSTTAAKAQDGAQQISGQFGEYLETGTNASAIIFPTLLVPGSSFASNSNDVSSVAAGGASTLSSRADHVHRGVRAISHTSNTYFGDVTLVAGANVGITRSADNTFRLDVNSATGGGGGGGGSGAATTNQYVTTAAAGDLTAEVVIPGMAASPDIRVAGASDQEYDSSTLGGTAMGTLTSEDANTTKLSHYYAKKAATAGFGLVGRHWNSPSTPFTMTAKLTAATMAAQFHRCGIFIGESTPGKLVGIYLEYGSGSGARCVSTISATTPTTGAAYVTDGSTSAQHEWPHMPVYMRIVVTSSTDVTYYWSADGMFFRRIGAANQNPGFTVGSYGIALDPENATFDLEVAVDWIRFT